VAFIRTKRSTERTALFTVRVNGTILRRLTSWGMSAGQPDYSPNGRWIAFYAQGQTTVELTHPNGRGLHVIANDPVSYGSLSFSTNGKKITVSHRVSNNANPDIYEMNIDGTRVRKVTATHRYESAPDWGPQPK
jgi:Tol biopolymer transport system component